MIVKNESKIIRRCFDACKNFIDTACICDTGSTDNTVEILNELVTPMNGKVAYEKWQNFGYNRTKSFQLAQEHVRELGWNLNQTYGLLLDADMIFHYDNFDKDTLTFDGYEIYQVSDYNKWINLRLIRMSRPWTCIRRTHEYWNSHNWKLGRLEQTPWIEDIGDGGSKADKFIRDIKLLTEDLAEDSNDVRANFYIAESHKNLAGSFPDEVDLMVGTGKFDDAGKEIMSIKKVINHNKVENLKLAITHYQKRVDIGKQKIARGEWDFDEERFCAQMYMGGCYLTLGKVTRDLAEQDKGLNVLAEAYFMRPQRLEPLYQIINHFRSDRRIHQFSTLLLSILPLVPNTPKIIDMYKMPNDGLFLERKIYEELIHLEKVHSMCYTTRREEGKLILDRLIHEQDVSESTAQDALLSEIWYADKLLHTEIVEVKFNIDFEDAQLAHDYAPMSWSILPELDSDRFRVGKSGLGYLAVVRAVNYQYVWDTHVNYPTRNKEDKYIRTKNFLFKLDKTYNAICLGEIVDASNVSRRESRIVGWEDCRAFRIGEDLWLSGTLLEGEENGAPRIVMGRINLTTLQIEHAFLLARFESRTLEKNWLPFTLK